MGPTRRHFMRLRFAEEPNTGEPKAGGITQEQLNEIVQGRVAAAERAAKEAAEKALADKLGGASLDDVIAAAKAAKDAEDAAKSEAQRDREAAAAEKAEAEKIKAAAKAELHTTRITAALTAAGAPEKAVAAITVPGITVDSTADEIKAAVAKLKADVPGLFTAKPEPKGDPGKGPDRQSTSTDFGADGKAEFERRYPKKA